jgi:hypothetical protein
MCGIIIARFCRFCKVFVGFCRIRAIEGSLWSFWGKENKNRQPIPCGILSWGDGIIMADVGDAKGENGYTHSNSLRKKKTSPTGRTGRADSFMRFAYAGISVVSTRG